MPRSLRHLTAAMVVVLLGACSGSDDPAATSTTVAEPSAATSTTGAPATTTTVARPTGDADAAGRFVVTDFGAVGDGKNDDSEAFQAAVDAAAEVGGTVVIPPVGGLVGYVLNHTVTVPRGVALTGAPAGSLADVGGPYAWPDTDVPGVKIFARPSPADSPLFRLSPGSTVRGLWITYDQQPLPDDAALTDSSGDFAYDNFEDARSFVTDHVVPNGPTFYIEDGAHVTVSDVVADRYYDFLHLKTGGPLQVDGVTLYGYRSGFTIEDSTSAAIFRNITFDPRATGPISPGPGPDNQGSTTWVFGAIASNPEHVGFHFGRSDGYVLDNVTFRTGHTAVRLGAAFDLPIVDPVTGDFFTSEPGLGPWGQISDIMVDQAAVAFHMVAPSPNATLISNATALLGIDDGANFEANTGSGATAGVTKQALILVEPSFSADNNGVPGQVPPILASNVAVGPASDPELVGGAAGNVDAVNGRVFLIDGAAGIEINGFSMRAPYEESYLVAAGGSVGEFAARLRGVLMLGRPEADKLVEATGVTVLAGDVVVIQPPPTTLPPPPPPVSSAPTTTTSSTTTTTTTTAAPTTTSTSEPPD